jgi:indole-3-glycerol phosphate synthase
MNFLAQIEELVRERLVNCRAKMSQTQLREKAAQARTAADFLTCLKKTTFEKGPAIIAEVKRKSPSRGAFAMDLVPVEVASAYARAGASAISVLTEPVHFGGSVQDLIEIHSQLPETALLMKDFVIDSYQLLQARAFGASAVLLMQSLLGQNRLTELYIEAIELGLQPLVEVHTEEELKGALEIGATLIGVNNRDLRTLNVSIGVSKRLASYITPEAFFISESGLNSRADLNMLAQLGYRGFLIGSALTKEQEPEVALRELIRRKP